MVGDKSSAFKSSVATENDNTRQPVRLVNIQHVNRRIEMELL